MPASCATGGHCTTEKSDLCPLFTGAAAPLFRLDAEDAAAGAPGFRHIPQIPQSELFKRMDRRPVSRIDQAEQAPAVEPLEPEGELRLAALGGNPPARGGTGEDEADCEVVRFQAAQGNRPAKPMISPVGRSVRIAIPVRL